MEKNGKKWKKMEKNGKKWKKIFFLTINVVKLRVKAPCKP
jgi:hypothetical protein